MKSLKDQVDSISVDDIESYKAIKQAYSDCNGSAGERNLRFVCTHPYSAEQLIRLVPIVIPDGYNDFDSIKTIRDLIETFGEDAEYFMARESSVCIYVKPKSRVWLSRSDLVVDELSIEKDGRIRCWWD